MKRYLILPIVLLLILTGCSNDKNSTGNTTKKDTAFNITKKSDLKSYILSSNTKVTTTDKGGKETFEF